jgi:glycosyltransferase involved in cell wall biosynthesis
MKIFYDGYIFACQKYGGINRLFLELARQLLVFNDAEMCLYGFPDNIINKYGIYGVPKISWLVKHISATLLPMSVRRFNPDIYHTSYYRIPNGIPGKKVITVYDMIYEIYPDMFNNSQEIIRCKRTALFNADLVIVISENTQNDVLRYYNIPRDKIKVCHLAAGTIFKDIATLQQETHLIRKFSAKPYLLFVGQRRGYKNFISLLKAYSIWIMNKDFDLVCVGGEENWDEKENAIIKKSGISRSVIKIGSVNDKRLRSFYSSASAFICPSLYEGFGIPILEAMACGTPVVLSNTSSMPEVAGEAALYFKPDSPDELLLALNRIVDDSALRQDLRSRGIERSKIFSWEKMAKEIYCVYKKLLE